jgi:hypothetical protein
MYLEAGTPEAEAIDNSVLLGLNACHQRRKLVDGRSVSLVTSVIPLDGSVGTAVHIHDLTQPEQRPDVSLVPNP